MQITITRPGIPVLTLDILPGTLKTDDVCVDAGSSVIPKIRAGKGVSGSCQVLLDSSKFTYAQAVALISLSGKGTAMIQGAAVCSDALIDVSITGGGLQVAVINWKGN